MIEASAPGSLMLMGEHAVLHGAHALVGAVDRRIRIQLLPRSDRQVTIESSLGVRSMTLARIDKRTPFQFVGAVLARYAAALPGGCTLRIQADMPPDVGLGTSAAVTTALLAALHRYAGQPVPAQADLQREVCAVIRTVQGRGSGADAAASVYGGIVLYQQERGVLASFDVLPDIRLYYAGYKTPTAEVIAQVNQHRATDPERFAELDRRMDACSLACAAALRTADPVAFARSLNEGQLLMEAIGVCDAAMQQMIAQIRGQAGVLAVKISGAGLGDCVLVTGPTGADDVSSYRRIPAQFSQQGVQVWRS